MDGKSRTLMWPQWEPWNEVVDGKAKAKADSGKLEHLADIPTLAGMRQSFKIHEKSKQVQLWDREALKGLNYIVTDKSPIGRWLKTIGRAEDGSCGGGTARWQKNHTPCIKA